MEHSIRVKFTMIFIGLMAAVLISTWAVNGPFLEGFYTKQKLWFLENAYENPNAIAVDKEFQGQNITEELRSLFSNDGEQTGVNRLLQFMNGKYNTTIVIQNSITGELIPLARDGKFLVDALHRYILGIIDPRTEILISQDDHQVQRIYDKRSQGYYFQSWGFLDDNRTIFITSAPLANVYDNTDILSELLVYMGLAALVLGSALMYYATKKVVSPIRPLAALSARVPELDLETRYTGDSEDEIGVLGRSMNALSEKPREIVGELKTVNNELQRDTKERIKIDETHKEFIANVSYELKAPVALIQGYAEGLAEGMAEDENSRNYYCKVIMDEAGKMNEMVKQFLTLTALRFGNGISVMERFDVVALVHGILLPTGILLQQKEARVIFDQEGPVWAWVDRFKMGEVITSYLNNAMDHLGGGRRTEIRLKRREEEVRITMFNMGRHILGEDPRNPRTKFYKVDKIRIRKYGGSGIGFPIVKAVTDSCNKSCGVKSVDGGVKL